MKRTTICCLVVLAFVCAPSAQGGLFEDIYHGFDVLATPSGAPIGYTSDGFRTNGSRLGRLRIMPDRVGHGYTLEFNRNFGNDSSGRPEVLDLGAYELELSGSTSATLGYTNRGFLIGNGEFNVSNLGYFIRQKTGFQDFELSGTLSAQGNLEINQFGFYTLDLDVSNRTSQMVADGVIVEGDEEATFDIGPITIKGNVFFDAFVALLAATGVDTTALEQLSPTSPIDRIADSIQEQLYGVNLVAGMQYMDDGQLPPAPALSLLGLTETGVLPSAQPLVSSNGGPGLIPEPGTLMLIASGTAFLWGARRR